MNNFNRMLDVLIDKTALTEAIAKWYPTDDEIEAYAEKNNLSWGQAEKKLVAQKKASGAAEKDKKYWDNERKRMEREDKKAEKANRPPKPKMTKAQYDKKCYDSAYGWLSDNPDYEGEDVWYDLADAVLYNTDVMDYLNYSYYSVHGEKISKIIAKDILAGDIYSFVDKARKDVKSDREKYERQKSKKQNQ